MLERITDYKNKLKDFARLSLKIQSSIDRKKARLEEDNRKLASINRNIGLFLINNPLASDLTFDEREKIILHRNERDTELVMQMDKLSNMREDIKNLTAIFTRNLLELVNGSTDNDNEASSEDEEVLDNEESNSQNHSEMSMKRAYDYELNEDEEEEKPVIKQPKLEETQTFKPSNATAISRQRKYKYIYKESEIHNDPNLSITKVVKNLIHPMKAKSSGQYFKCATCKEMFCPQKVFGDNKKCFVIIWSMYPDKLCKCDE